MKLLSRIITGSVAALMTLCVSAAGYADYADCNKRCETRCEPRCAPKCAPKKECCAPRHEECCAPKKRCCTPPKKECCAPRHEECCDECWGFTVFGDLLYWTACQELPFATTATETSYLDYDWDLGFRIGLGFNVPCSCWEGALVWTHFSTDVDGTATAALPFLAPGVTVAADITTEVELEYDTIDFVLGFPCCLCSCVEFKPFGGVRGLWIDFDTTETTGEAATASRSTSYEAVGLYGGFDWKTEICDDWTLFGRFAGSAVVGDQDSTTTATIGDADPVTFTANSKCHGAFGFEAKIGAGWETCICDWDIAFSIAYDFVIWTDLISPTAPSALLSTTSTDLTLHGGSIGASFTF